ncbi:MAG: multidrug effflux MFS transporter [Pseudomonadota bacterium]
MSSKSGANAAERAGGDLVLILLLAAVTAIGPFAMHALAPALPSIAQDFEVSAAAAQLTLSLSLVAMAISNLIWGPLSDRYGRRPILLIGLAMGATGSVLAALAPELWVVILGRLLQASGAAAGMVLARAVAQDVYGQHRAAGVIGQITGVMVAAPMIAPTVAGLVVDWANWPGVFWMSAALCLMLWGWSASSLQETAPKGAAGTGTLDMVRGFFLIGGRRAFWRYAGYAAFSLAGFYYFVAIAPFVMREAFGQSAGTYGLYFILLSGTFMFTNLIAGRVSARFGGEQVLMFGAILSLVGPILVATALLVGLHHPLVLFLPGMIQSFGAGLAMPNAMAGAVGAAPERAGAASGLLGFSQFIISALTTQAAGFLPHNAAMVVPVGMGGCILIGIVFLVVLKDRLVPVR